MPDVQVLAPGVSAAPLTYTVPGSQEILIKALSASFDGTGAAGAFVPAVRIIAPGGKLAGVFIANGQVSAGDSVYASWAPFLAGAGPNGIQFDVPNQGNWLAVTTLGAAPLSGDGIELSTFGGGGVEVLSGDFLTLSSQQDGLVIESNDAAIPLQMRSAGGMTIQDTSAGILLIENTGGGEVDITTTGTGTQVYRSADGFVWFSNHTGGGEYVYVFHLSQNDGFMVRDHNGDAILQVNEVGPEYHIKAGKAWVADL